MLHALLIVTAIHVLLLTFLTVVALSAIAVVAITIAVVTITVVAAIALAINLSGLTLHLLGRGGLICRRCLLVLHLVVLAAFLSIDILATTFVALTL